MGTGIFEEHLVRQIEKSLERNANLRFRMIIDEARGTRHTKMTNGYICSSDLLNEIKASNVNRDIEVGLLSANTAITNSKMLKEVLGVHHCKFAVFDNSVVLTGANLEEQYFTTRRDRYWVINNVPELADYLEDYLMT